MVINIIKLNVLTFCIYASWPGKITLQLYIILLTYCIVRLCLEMYSKPQFEMQYYYPLTYSLLRRMPITLKNKIDTIYDEISSVQISPPPNTSCPQVHSISAKKKLLCSCVSPLNAYIKQCINVQMIIHQNLSIQMWEIPWYNQTYIK